MTESNVERIFQAVLSCPHQITGEEVVLGYSDSKPGKNALAQLHSRIAEALALRTPSDGVKVGPVTRDDAIAFLETACRNWSSVPKLSEDDIGDVAMELLRFATKRLATPGKE